MLPARRQIRGWLLASFAGTAIAACAGLPPSAPPTPQPPAATTLPPDKAPAPVSEPSAPTTGVIAKSDRILIYSPKQGESLRSIAREFLGDEERDWEIAALNEVSVAQPGEPLVIPLQPRNPLGVFRDGYQLVPILSYHRIGRKNGKMVVTPEAFAAQLDYLEKNDYRVVRLSELVEFLAGERALPRRSVVITFDDGYASTYVHAFPLLEKHGFPATVFLYTDFVGAKDALTWDQMKEMVASGLIDIQSHSKTHANLADRLPGESADAYRKRVDAEVRSSQRLLEAQLGMPVLSFAYPFGDANSTVLDRLARADYRLAVTVNPGSNPFFAHPLMLQRSMILGDHDLEAFKSKLHVFRQVGGQ